MLDAPLRRLVDPLLDRIGRALAGGGVGADGLTGLGLVLGLGAAAALAAGREGEALALFALNRLCDGLDGAVARAGGASGRGGFLDIVADFAVYGAIPLAFALREPEANALAAAALLFAFYVNGASFLAFAAVAAERGLQRQAHGSKAIYFTVGLAEGAETIAFFVAMMLRPAWFVPLALAFAGLTLMSAVTRATLAWWVFGPQDEADGDA